MGEYRCERLFLQGRIKIIIDPTEFRMALWINGFGVSDAITGNEIIPVCYSYNLEHVEETEDSLEIDFRIYPEGHVYYHVSINPLTKYLRIRVLYTVRMTLEILLKPLEKIRRLIHRSLH